MEDGEDENEDSNGGDEKEDVDMNPVNGEKEVGDGEGDADEDEMVLGNESGLPGDDENIEHGRDETNDQADDDNSIEDVVGDLDLGDLQTKKKGTPKIQKTGT